MEGPIYQIQLPDDWFVPATAENKQAFRDHTASLARMLRKNGARGWARYIIEGARRQRRVCGMLHNITA